MGTRGCYGFRKNGKDKITYCHFDSYPDELGQSVVEFCKETNVQEMNNIFDDIILVNEREKPTLEQMTECINWLNLSVSTQTANDWYCLLRNAQGDLTAYKKKLRYMIDKGRFIKDSLFCEYGYIINLDENILEFWKGFQEKPQSGNRYGEEADEEGYYPCKLVLTFPLLSIPDDAIEKMNETDKKEVDFENYKLDGIA